MGLGDDFLDIESTSNTTGNKRVGPYLTKKLLYGKINDQQSEKTTMGMGTVFANYISDEGLTFKFMKN